MSNAPPQTAAAPARSRRGQPPAPTLAPTLWEQWRFLIIAVGMVLVCGTMIVGTFSVLRQVQAAKKETEAVKAQLAGNFGHVPAMKDSSDQAVNRDGDQKLFVASPAYRARLLSFQSRLQVAVQTVRDISSVCDLWDTEYSDLLTNEQGRRIASDPEGVRSFITLLDMERPNLAMIVGMRDRINNLQTPVDEALSKDGKALAMPVEELFGEVDQLLADFAPVHSSMEMQKRLAQDLVFKFAKANPSPKTLGEVVQEIRLEASERKLAELTAARKSAQEAADALVIAVEKDAIAARGKAVAEARRLLGEKEAEEIVEDAKLRRETLEADLAKRKEEQRVAELRKRASDPLVQRKYSAFLDKGLATFSYGAGNSSPGDRPLPASWGELNRNGFVKDVQAFAKSLSAQAFHTGTNDRRVAAMPKTEAEWKEADRLYEDFKLLGPIWVEMGLLLP